MKKIYGDMSTEEKDAIDRDFSPEPYFNDSAKGFSPSGFRDDVGYLSSPHP